MASITPAGGPLSYEDSVTRFATPAQAQARGIVESYTLTNYTLIDGPNAGSVVSYWLKAGTGGGGGGGTVTANQGTPNTAANAWPTYLTVGGIAIDPRTIRTLTSADTVTVVQPTGTNLHVNVDNFPATQPVSGTVTANQGTPNTAANAWSTFSTVAGVAIDPRSIRALTSTDVVTVVQPTGTSLHTNVDNFPATQAVTGTVAISNFPATQTVAGAQTPGDTVANPTDAQDTRTFLELWNGATWDRWKSLTTGSASVTVAVAGLAIDPRTIRTLTTTDQITVFGSKTPADAFANPTDASDSLSFGMLWNGTTWDRIHSSALTTGAVLVGGNKQPVDGFSSDANSIGTMDFNMVWNGATWDRMHSSGTGNTTGSAAVGGPFNVGVTISSNPAPVLVGGWDPGTLHAEVAGLSPDTSDALATLSNGNIMAFRTIAEGYVFNGTTWDRHRSAGALGVAAVGGGEASGVAVASNPVLTGARASTVPPTAVGADGQAVALWASRQGRLKNHDDRPNIRAVIYGSSPSTTVTVAADAATVGRFFLFNPVGSTTLISVRRVSAGYGFAGVALALTTSPTFNLQRFTATGTLTGAAVGTAQRDSTDTAQIAQFTSASTGLTITALNAVDGFTVPPILTAIGTYTPPTETIVYAEDERVVLRAGEGLFVRQATAGSTGDLRTFQIDFVWEEYQ